MATFNLSTNFTTSNNRERVNLYKASAPTAIVDQLTKNAPHVGGHLWAFFNLIPSENYRYDWIEIDGSGNLIRVIGSENFSVPAYGSTKSKATQYLIADTTPGVNSGLSTIVMDGANGTDDWRGWDIVWEKKGFGTEFPGIEINYDITTGELALTNADSSPYEIAPGERFVVHFEDQTIGVAPVVVSGSFSGIRYINGDDSIAPADFGKNLIQVDGQGLFLTITLPPIASVAENTELIIKSGKGNHKNIAVTSVDPNAIDWLQGNKTTVYLGVCESIKIYRQNHTGVNTWQIIDADGNFKLVGIIVPEYSPIGNVFNRVPATSALCDRFQHARLYEMVQRMTLGAEVVTFNDWTNNKQKYSLVNVSGQFHVPDLSDLYLRATDGTRLPGTFLDHQSLQHAHELTSGTLPNPPFGQSAPPKAKKLIGKYLSTHENFTDFTSTPIDPATGNALSNFGVENRPKTAIVKQYILC